MSSPCPSAAIAKPRFEPSCPLVGTGPRPPGCGQGKHCQMMILRLNCRISRQRNQLLTSEFSAVLSLHLRIWREFAWRLSGRRLVKHEREPMTHARRPRPRSSARRRRAAAQHVREARDRLTSTTGTRPAFDYELLRQFAQNRLSASLVVLLLVGTVGLPVQLLDRRRHGRRLDRCGAGHPRRHRHQVPAVPVRAVDHAGHPSAGGCASSCSISSTASPGCTT